MADRKSEAGQPANSGQSAEGANSLRKLPQTHPEFKYGPSKNPYTAKLERFRGTAFADNETETYRGKWRELVSKNLSPGSPAPADLWVELGCNGGHWLLEKARMTSKELAPNQAPVACVGIDWKIKQIYLAAEKAEKRGIQNTIFLKALSERLPYIFAPSEISTLCLFFPDPWSKKSQLKHRIFQAHWLRAIAPMVQKDGLFWIKTDHAGYAEWMKQVISECSDTWRLESESHDLYAGRSDAKDLKLGEVTLFERLFIQDELPIHEYRLRRI